MSQLPLLLLPERYTNKSNLKDVLLRVPVQESIMAEKGQQQEHEAAGQGASL